MSKKAWIISYIFVILTALCFISIFVYFEWNIFISIALFCVLFCTPIIKSKKGKEIKGVTYTIEHEFIYTYFVLFLFSALLCSLFFHIMPEKYENYFIANSKNIEKANEIQNFLTTRTRPTSRHIVTNEIGDKQYYAIAIDRNSSSKQDSIQIQTDLLKSSIMDDSVNIMINPKYTKNKKELLKRVEEELRWIIWNINGIESVSVSIYLDEKNINSTDNNIKKISVDIETKEGADCKNIHTQIYMLVKGIVKDNPSTEINIYNSTLYNNARLEYKNKNYFKAWELLEILETFNYDNIHSDVVALIKFIDVDDKIKKSPNNYKLYIERGDLKNIPLFSMFSCNSTFLSDIEGAIEDYNKALELNPKAYEVYEKRGNAWAEVSHNEDRTIGTKALRYPEDDQHAIDDYKKAIELTGGNDKLYERLGDMYKDPKMKLQYYTQVKNLYPEYLPVPYKVNQLDFSFDTGPFFHLPLKMANCYVQLGEYDEAIKILEKTKKHGEHHYTATNLIFLYNWKAGHYKEALKIADDCSVWVCKVLGLIF